MTCFFCSYQPPIPADQVRPAAEFDQDAGVLLLIRNLCSINPSLVDVTKYFI